MYETIDLIGKIHFEPENKTKKHNLQSSWKKMAMVMLDGDLCEYYAWFISKRYNLTLNKPLRGAHISFINDSIQDLSKNGQRSLDETERLWNSVKDKWDNKPINITLSLDPRTDDRTWWLNIPQDKRDDLHAIRAELGLGRPYWGLHMTIGIANEKNIDHSKYIHRLIKKGFIS
jgi:hypothetical protein